MALGQPLAAGTLQTGTVYHYQHILLRNVVLNMGELAVYFFCDSYSLKAINHTQNPIRLKTSWEAYNSNSVKILEVFRSNLAKWYSPTQVFDKTKADTLFANISLPTLESEQYALLESPITAKEVQNAIKALKPHKKLGPDGFSALYFVPILIPVLTRAFNPILTGHLFRTEKLTSIIFMLPKPKSHSTSWTNYRPISLLNLDKTISQKL